MFAVLLGAAPAAAGKELPRDEAGVARALKTLAEVSGPGESFEVWETEHYCILYNGEKEIAIQRGHLLEKLQRHYFLFLRHVGIEHRPLELKLVALVFDHQDDFLRYAQADGFALGAGDHVYIEGYYSSGTNRAAFFNQQRGGAYERTKEAMIRLAESLEQIPGGKDTPVKIIGPEGPRWTTKGEAARELVEMKKELIATFENENRVVTQHEGAHQLAFNAGLQRRGAAYPFWVSEGLACTFESPGTRKGFGAFRVNGARLEQYRDAQQRGTVKGLRGLVTLPPESRENVLDLYAESWALFFFLAKTRPKELSAYLKDLAARERTAEFDGEAEWALFARHFDVQGDKLENEWQLFLRRLK
ncbi:MAG: DUF1570 domain-containing protein [Phycisphaerales bacterium]|nr:MAG: DUF1570 domain-containing protein [Phycisphaerales bacterium]